MKFAQYLDETQTPEWKKAYIDYRGLKKRISAIRHAHQSDTIGIADNEQLVLSPTSDRASDASVDLNVVGMAASPRPSRDTVSSGAHSTGPASSLRPGARADALRMHSREDQTLRSHSALSLTPARNDQLNPSASHVRIHTPDVEGRRPPPVRATTVQGQGAVGSGQAQRTRGSTFASTLRAFTLPRLNSLRGTTNGTVEGHGGPRFDLGRPIPLIELLPQLTAVERAFFEKLDQELDKVESFYSEREKDMHLRADLLKEQLQELKDHRRAFYEAHPATAAPSWLHLHLPLPPPLLPDILIRRRKGARDPSPTIRPHSLPPPTPDRSGKTWRSSISKHSDPPTHVHVLTSGTEGSGDQAEPHSDETDATLPAVSSGTGSGSVSGSGRRKSKALGVLKIMSPGFSPSPSPGALEKNATSGSERTDDGGADADNEEEEAHENDAGESSGSANPNLKSRQGSSKHGKGLPLRYDPEEYQHAKKQLKKAVLECYRGLELLNNYRTLNLIGFRKALKKFEKVTKIPAQVAYTKEKIEPSAISSGAALDLLIDDMEALFAARFARGDKKRARARLRGGAKLTTHHFSTFCTGMALGLGIPALAAGLYQSFQEETRAEIPGWGGLMFVYAVFFVPTFFSLLVGANLLVWARARINYVFIFELDLRTKMDYRVYFQLPAFLLSLLCYAFWLSFSRIGTRHVVPGTWPLLWLLFTGLVVINPLPVMWKPTRVWLLRNISRLLTAGVHRVEFADFWMGDQFCSLTFTLGNLFFVGCLYARGIDQHWRQCMPSPGPRWGIAFLLAALPLLVRLVQSVKRYVDSGLVTHLINGGKYGSGILQILFYFLWRSQGGVHGPMFVAWCVFATSYSIYAGAWDLLMDWSLLRPHAPYSMLRQELLYHNAIPFYYFAIVSNILIRFIWVIYIPTRGPNYIIRTFIAAMLEILRRWQWNFLRLENEHLGNIDQYRVTREVPLPYTHEDHSHDSDGDDEDDAKIHRSGSSRRSWRTPRRGRGFETDGTAAESGVVSDI
ncbi:transporter [Ganoderma sinense ZZ0214-1]|uniref:Transporter n=1 Tax=Ganoderma sinense ZZ0214-1 TaxID=1077348 RepID=A0A2G8RP88_9APHY|nr:transporter [Ganoderma sinense ZZ0214-1]